MIRVVLVLFVIQSQSESRAVNNKFKYNKLLVKMESLQTDVLKCNGLPESTLNDILGAAFNSRYMSVSEPPPVELQPKNQAGKRYAQNFKPFYVDDTYAMEISDEPAWEVKHLSELEKENNKRIADEQNSNSTRSKRASNRRRVDDSNQERQERNPWECEAIEKWLDLGIDYYPRYLRTVECTRSSCWYGHFTCKPRSFTVKLLRRRRGECVQTKNKIGIVGLHGDLKEKWIWEERAVNFCCDCSL